MIFHCILLSFTSLGVSEDGHSHMGGSDVAAILACEALLHFTPLQVVELGDVPWLFGNN